MVSIDELTEEQLEQLLASKRNAKQANRDAYKNLVDETVVKSCQRLVAVADLLSQVKSDVFGQFREVLQLKEDVFSVKEKQRSHTFTTEQFSITIGYRVNDGWDNTVSAGVAKVNNFIQSLARDDNSAALVETIFNLLKKDVNGNLRANRVIELQKLTAKFSNVEFTDGVNIILNAYKPVKSCWFIDAWSFNAAGEKVNIPLSISAADFLPGFEFDFFNKTATATGVKS